ncbi:hypothetical protein TFLX_04116 [Thermoflexales bacterium]|nr:hypothetical protein TFLX_04116 [Thermoflexales bacterium]
MPRLPRFQVCLFLHSLHLFQQAPTSTALSHGFHFVQRRVGFGRRPHGDDVRSEVRQVGVRYWLPVNRKQLDFLIIIGELKHLLKGEA